MRTHYRLVALALSLACAPLAIAQQTTAAPGSGSNALGRSGLNTGFAPVLTTPLGSTPAPGAAPNASGIARMAVVSPVPEPSEWMLMLTGLGVVGAIARRRAKRS